MTHFNDITKFEHDLEAKIEQFEGKIEQKLSKWKRGRMAWIGSFVLALSLGIALLISSHAAVFTNSPMLDQSHTLAVAQWVTDSTTSDQAAISNQPAIDSNGIEITLDHNLPVENASISRNPEVVLTSSQAKVVKAFGDYLNAHDAFAIVTSGKRTSEQQLDIIKERISEHGADSKFPHLEQATLADTKIWLRAWQWLRRKHVPVNAPAEVPGADVRTSMHLKGLAIDFISDNLDHLRSMLADFSRSKYATEAPLKITGIVREPGCVHINLG